MKWHPVVFFLVVASSLVASSCSDLGVDPRFSFQSVLAPDFTIPANGALDSSVAVRVWYDTAGLSSEDRGTGLGGADVDSTYVQRVYLHSQDSLWPLGQLSRAWVMIGTDTIASADLPDYTTDTFIFPDTTLTSASRDLGIVPGDSVDVRLGYTLRTPATAAEPVLAGITVESIARAKIVGK